MVKIENNLKSKLDKAANLWSKANFPIAFTGAGISVPSGIPDFRSPGGLWSKYDPFEVASAQALETNPLAVWKFLLETCDILDKSYPNPAHYALAKLEENHLLKGIITQNIDNLHQRAGSKNVVEYHGNFQRFYCQRCYNEESVQDIRKLTLETIPLYCEKCEGLIRPDVVFFGESIPTKAQYFSMDLIQKADLILITGTSGEVSPANFIPRQVKLNSGQVIEINLGQTYYEDITDIRFDDSVDMILPSLAEKILI